MAQANYPYLDLTVLPQIRDHVITSNAALLFDKSLENVLWANGEGSKLIGAPAVRAVLENNISPNPVMMRQIKTAAEKLDTNLEATAIMRVRSGFKTRLLGFTVRPIKLPGGEVAVLLLTENVRDQEHNATDMAKAAVDCLDGYSNAAAVLDANGEIIAASRHFSSLLVSKNELELLVQEVSTEDDRLIKRPIQTQKGDFAAGIARLTDNPASHILIIANGERDVAADDAPDKFQQGKRETSPTAATACTKERSAGIINRNPKRFPSRNLISRKSPRQKTKEAPNWLRTSLLCRNLHQTKILLDPKILTPIQNRMSSIGFLPLPDQSALYGKWGRRMNFVQSPTNWPMLSG